MLLLIISRSVGSYTKVAPHIALWCSSRDDIAYWCTVTIGEKKDPFYLIACFFLYKAFWEVGYLTLSGLIWDSFHIKYRLYFIILYLIYTLYVYVSFYRVCVFGDMLTRSLWLMYIATGMILFGWLGWLGGFISCIGPRYVY